MSKSSLEPLSFWEIPAVSSGKKEPLPLLLSSPHSGTEIPNWIHPPLLPKWQNNPPDTDWHVHKLYDFAPHLGITLIHARYSRAVIDLNRHPDNVPLYKEKNRQVTELVPQSTFNGQTLYEGKITEAEIHKRKEKIYQPYYQKIETELLSLKARCRGPVLLWDCHSIHRSVPEISPQAFADVILGSNDEMSAAPLVIETALKSLEKSGLSVAHNFPFKGGQITRQFGKPSTGIHALQLEMSQDIYMDEASQLYQPEKARRVRDILSQTLLSVSKVLMQMREGHD